MQTGIVLFLRVRGPNACGQEETTTERRTPQGKCDVLSYLFATVLEAGVTYGGVSPRFPARSRRWSSVATAVRVMTP